MVDTYIREAMVRRVSVTVYTINGYQIKGTIFDDCDSYIVLLSNGKKKMIYKHAISTIEPS